MRTSTATTALTCTIDSAAAVRRFSSWAVWRKISVSSVDRVGPPRIKMTPNDVNVKRKTIAAAPTSAGRNAGSTTEVNARHRLAPSTRAASSCSGSRCDQKPPTIRTTTA